MTQKQKLEILDHFYEYMTEDDWLEGIDLYQSGKITNLTVYHGLISGKVAPMIRAGAEVRLKMHPSGKAIQWIECTCAKNRKHGYYCEHIAAFMIYADREKHSFFVNLDAKMPIKPPVKPKNSQKSSTNQVSEHNGDAAQKVLDHLQGSIQSVTLLSHGPKLRVKLEIKVGNVTHYDLEIDAAVKFLKSQSTKNQFSQELKELITSSHKIEFGTFISSDDEEKITAEKVVCIIAEHLENLANPNTQYLKKTCKKINLNNSSISTDEYFIFPIKNVTKFLGENSFFIPSIGYFELDNSSKNSKWDDLSISKAFKQDQAAKLIARNFEEFKQAGHVWLDETLSDTELLEAPTLSSIQVHSENNGWFFLDPTYTLGKNNISMAQLRTQYRNKKREFFKTGNVWMKIPDFVIQNEWDLDETGSFIKVDALGLMRLKADLGELDKFVGSKAILEKVRNKTEFNDSFELPHLNNPRLNLREYQNTGLKWLWWLYKNSLHGLLADDMGLGKTHQTMALFCAIQEEEKKSCKFLVVCPTSVIDHWEDKIIDFSPQLNAQKFHGPKREIIQNKQNPKTITVITSYGVLLRDAKLLAEEQWDAIVLDEAHYVKNNDTSTYKAACSIPSKIRICLSGTPMENHLMELKNIFDFLLPGYLGSDKFFKRNFIQPIELHEKPDEELKLQKLIHPFKLRRTKQKVLDDLPEKVEEIRHCSLSEDQVKLYRDVINHQASTLVKQLEQDDSPTPYLHVFATLQLLKQICNHPALVASDKDFRKYTSGKFELLKELVHEALGSNNKIVIFSQYVGMIDIIKQYLEEQNVQHVIMTGQSRNRGKIIEQFQKDENIKIFVGSLLAGGIGIDLTAASVVIHYDRWWNPSKENQATDRVHRIGQKNFVQVMKLVTKGTLEEKIDKIIESKKFTFERFLEKDEEIFKTLTRQELIDLLK